jgi:hypothetical protein
MPCFDEGYAQPARRVIRWCKHALRNVRAESVRPVLLARSIPRRAARPVKGLARPFPCRLLPCDAIWLGLETVTSLFATFRLVLVDSCNKREMHAVV